MNPNAIRLIRRKQGETPQEREARLIRERRTGEKVPYGEGEIDNKPTAKFIPVDEVLACSFLNAVQPQRIPLSRKLLRLIEKLRSLIW